MPSFETLPLFVEDDAVGLAPGQGLAAKAWREVLADQPPPLRTTPFIVVEHAAIVEEDVCDVTRGRRHSFRWQVSLRAIIWPRSWPSRTS